MLSDGNSTENVETWEPGENLGWSWKFLISDGFAADTIFPDQGWTVKVSNDHYMKSNMQNVYGSGTIRT